MATFFGPRTSIFGTRFCNFLPKYLVPKKAPIRLIPLRPNITSWKTKRYALNSQRSQLFNASKISSQLALEAFIWINLCKKKLTNFQNAFSNAFYALFWVRKIVRFFLTKIDPYKCFQSELGADFLCIKELRSLAVQCISFRPSTRNIWS